MGNCLRTLSNDGPPPVPPRESQIFSGAPTNQLYPQLGQQNVGFNGQFIQPTAPPPYSERDPNLPQVTNGRRSVRHVQSSRPSLFTQTQMQPDTKILVAAIDFGTTFSGYAFSFRHEYEADRLKISTNLWPHNSGLSSKAPSAAVISSDGHITAFGYEAQKNYSEMVENGTDQDYLYFEKFKMVLYNTENLNTSTPIYDVKGRQMLAIDVFGLIIGYMRNHLLQRLFHRDNKSMLDENMIQWVLTVPAIWNDKAKQFMRRAAEKGGIKSENLTLALEPEAASMYCRHVPQCISANGGSVSTATLENGTKYLILDLGGGTVDVTVHEIQADGTLQEVHHATGGCWGGTTVDSDFLDLLINIFGSDVISTAKTRHPNELLDMFLDFEMKKRTFEPCQTTNVSLKCPACLYEIHQEINNISIQEKMLNSEMKNKVEFKRDKIFIFADTFRSLFQNSITSIVQHVTNLLQSPPITGVTTILLVGGYSDSYVIKDAIVTNFPHMRIINPDDCSLAVLKGAVLFGHNPKTISSRVSKYTYGIVINKDFIEGVHPESKRKKIQGVDICDDIFDIHIKRGEKIEIGKPRPEKSYLAPYPGATNALLEVYMSTSSSPTFVTEESCSLLGTLVVELSPNDKSTEQIVDVSFHYCGTELEVSAREKATGKIMKAKFDFIG